VIALSTYYDILGISQTAGTSEIKRAFRRLAKLYHPDKNPADKDSFARILKAYETLVDPGLRLAYDRRLNINQSQEQKSGQHGAKNWTFEEREQRRRKYYEEHIKKYEKSRVVYTETTEQKSSYNEYKYILFATPLAVALLLLVIRLAVPQDEPVSRVYKTGPVLEDTVPKTKSIPQAPYLSVFGEERSTTKNARELDISNRMGLDAVLCLFRKGSFVRSIYLAQDSLVHLEQLPGGSYQLRLMLGRNYLLDKKLKFSGVNGGFEYAQTFYISKTSINLDSIRHLELGRVSFRVFSEVNEEEFFTFKRK